MAWQLPRAFGEWMFTFAAGKFARLRVDPQQTSLFTGRQGRSFLEFSIPAGTSHYIQLTGIVDTFVYMNQIAVDQGSLRFEVIRNGTPSGTWTPLPYIVKSRLDDRPTPLYALQNTLATGGTVTGGEQYDVYRIVTGSNPSTVSSVATEGGARGVPPGVYWYKLTNIGTGACTGTWHYESEERA